MRLIVILVVVAIVGWLAATSFKSQTNAVGAAARQAGIDVPQSAPPRQQVEALGKAVEQLQADQAARQRQQIEDAEK